MLLRNAEKKPEEISKSVKGGCSGQGGSRQEDGAADS